MWHAIKDAIKTMLLGSLIVLPIAGAFYVIFGFGFWFSL